MLAVGLYFYIFTGKGQQASKVSVNHYALGLTNNCRAVPKFIPTLKMGSPAFDSRQQDGLMGLYIRDYAKKESLWHHDSWEMMGYIGAFDRDRVGNVYVSPLPYVSLTKNPPEKQNQIYIIDSKTAEMSLFLKLPAEALPNAKNPFGAMGLYYDCDTDSLYVSSLSGSEPKQENGIIFQINTKTKKIKSKLEGVDAIGLGVINTQEGKRLYFGSARNSHLFSISLNNQGGFFGEKRYETSLSKIKGGDSTVIKKIAFKLTQNKFLMTLKEMEFGFRLLAENNPFKKKYHFELDSKTNTWTFTELSKE